MSLRDAQSPGDISSLVMLMSFFKLLTIHLTMNSLPPCIRARVVTATDFPMTPFSRRIVSSNLSTQSAMLLLRHSGVPKMANLIRCISPACISEIAAEFDLTVMHTTLFKLDIRLGEYSTATIQLLRAPLRLGGFGLTSAQESSPAAYIASVASVAASESTTVFRTSSDATHALPSASLLHRWLEHSLERVSRSCASYPPSSSSSSSSSSLSSEIGRAHV